MSSRSALQAYAQRRRRFGVRVEQSSLSRIVGRHPAGRGHHLLRVALAVGVGSRTGVRGRADRLARVLRHGPRAQTARAGPLRGRRRRPLWRCTSAVLRGAAGPLVAMLVIVFWMSAVAEVRQPAVVQFVRPCSARSGSTWWWSATCPVSTASASGCCSRRLLLGVWASDVAAFTIGRLFGRRLLGRGDLTRQDGRGVPGRARRRDGHGSSLRSTAEPDRAPALAHHPRARVCVAIALAAPIGDLLEKATSSATWA